MLKSLLQHIANYRHYYLWPVIGEFVVLGSFKNASWLNHGKPILDDPNAIAAYGIQSWPVLLALFWTAVYSAFLNNSLTQDQYAKITPLGQFVDNLPEIVIFLAILAHYHFQ